jgi:hypothetical protein
MQPIRSAACCSSRPARPTRLSDCPHPEGTYSYRDSEGEIPRTRLSLAFTCHGLTLDKVLWLLGLNALDAFPISTAPP